MGIGDTLDRRYLLRKYHQSKAILVTDFHLGFEAEWSHSGITSKEPTISYSIIDQIASDIHKTNANHLIILGDLIHSIFDLRPTTKGKLWKTPDWILEKVCSYFQSIIISNTTLTVSIIRGNQDFALESFFPSSDFIFPSEGIQVHNSKLGVFHGDTPPSMSVLLASELMLGHIHPMIELTDEMGMNHQLPVFAKLTLPQEEIFKMFGLIIDEDEIFDIGLIDLVKIIILPSYNPHIPGFILNNRKGIMRKTQGFPLLRKIISHPELEIQMTDGVELGYLEDI